MGGAYYNENDPRAAAWIRELIKAGLIAPGIVDERDIRRIDGRELASYAQVHLFAGIGGWSYALRLAGWPDDRPVWTGSCPCQPFSCAGKRKGRKDARHLWPWMRHLLFRCRPSVAFGEQVASRDGREWLSGVRANLETLGYAVGAADLCAAGEAAPHIRQRLYWVADSSIPRCSGRKDAGTSRGDAEASRGWSSQPERNLLSGGLEHPSRDGRLQGWPESGGRGTPGGRSDGRNGLVNSQQQGLEGYARHGDIGSQSRWLGSRSTGSTPPASPTSFWADSRIIYCRDGKCRRVPIEPALFPLADGITGRVGLLRGAGNAIVPQVAARFIRAYAQASGMTL